MKLTESAKTTLRAAGVTQAEWARANYMRDGKWSGDVCGCPDSGRCANGFHHMGTDDCGCLPALLESYLAGEGIFDVTRAEELQRRRGGAPVMTDWGPFETRDEASACPAVREIHEARHAFTGPVTAETRRADEAMISALILAACEEAGVTLGAYDRRIAEWLAGFEPEACAVVAGLIRRAAAAKGDPDGT